MSPLRQLVHAHTEHLISREEYLHLRRLLMDKLEKTGDINANDLDNFLNLKNVSSNNNDQQNYDFSDILIAVLGIVAAAILGYMLYS